MLIAGGTSNNYPSAELYDPGTNTFTPTTGSMVARRFSHSATLLDDGTVLIAGGRDEEYGQYQSAEIYNPGTNTFSSTTGLMTTASQDHSATLLPNGTVLIAGGQHNGLMLIRAEIYSPFGGTFTWLGSMVAGRVGHDAVLLGDGTVLLANGHTEGALGAGGKMAEIVPIRRRGNSPRSARCACRAAPEPPRCSTTARC